MSLHLFPYGTYAIKKAMAIHCHDSNIYLYTLAVSPSLGDSRQHKRNNKNNGGFTPFFQPSLDGTAEATQPIFPRLPQLTSLHRCRLPYCPYHRAASTRQPRGNSRCQSELRHNHSPLIPIPSTLTCLPYIHPPIIQGSLYSIHPPKPRPPSSTSPINFCTHYLFQ